MAPATAGPFFFRSRPSAASPLPGRAQEGQLKSAGELTHVSQPADFRFVCCSSVPTPVPECPPHTNKPAPILASESCRHLGPVPCPTSVAKLCSPLAGMAGYTAVGEVSA